MRNINARSDGNKYSEKMNGEIVISMPTKKWTNLRLDSGDNTLSFNVNSLIKIRIGIDAKMTKNVHHSLWNGIHTGNSIIKIILGWVKWQRH